ncbi:MAG: hypothetical protein E7252_05445 [Lachnospira sp.]|nr:hypothetical protein [Lachnospira sp.]
MKKIKIIVLFVMLLALTACNKKELTIKEIHRTQCEHDDTPLNHKSEYNMSSTFYKNIFKKNNELTITINGKEYTGVYHDSEVYLSIGYKYDNYRSSECNFDINRKTGKIVNFRSKIAGEEVSKRDKETCLQAAIDFINNHDLGIDLDKYELVYADDGDGAYQVYDFKWRGKIDGVYTASNFMVRVSKVTDKIRFESEYLDMMDDLTLPDTYDKEAIDKMVDERLNGIYSEIKDTYTIDWRAKELQYLVKLRNGKTALICETTSYLQPNDKSKHRAGDTSEFIIFLE